MKQEGGEGADSFALSQSGGKGSGLATASHWLALGLPKFVYTFKRLLLRPFIHCLAMALAFVSPWALRSPQMPIFVRAPLLRLVAVLVSVPAFNPIPNPSSILQDIWGSILRAVPKQRKSYSRTRSRQMAGKALKDVTSVVKCSSCGRPKRSHILCPYCVLGMFWCFSFAGLC